LHSHADKSSIMSMYMKRGFLLLILFSLALAGLSAGDAWVEDAARGNDYFQAGDYDAAWLFYQRALARGCNDGMALFQAAESFRFQDLSDNPREENPDFESDLYAVARYFLEGQYPDSSAMTETGKYIKEGTVVNRRFLRQTYAVVGGTAPKKIPGEQQLVGSGLGSLSGFFLSRVEDLTTFIAILSTGDYREAFAWTKENIWSFLLSILIINALTGIILPIVMAVTVAREGRKSYVTAYAFLLHWGMLGIHRFYLGRYVSGIIWLFTGGLFGIGVFFDIFLTGAYIRFWNEDHRDERPVNRQGNSGKVRQPKVKKVKPPKAPRSSKAPKAPKPPKKKKEKKKKDRAPAEIDKSEEFSFAEDLGSVASGSAAVAASADLAAPDELMETDQGSDMDFSMSKAETDTASENDFGDLPDLSFDDEKIRQFLSSSDTSVDFLFRWTGEQKHARMALFLSSIEILLCRNRRQQYRQPG